MRTRERRVRDACAAAAAITKRAMGAPREPPYCGLRNRTAALRLEQEHAVNENSSRD